MSDGIDGKLEIKGRNRATPPKTLKLQMTFTSNISKIPGALEALKAAVEKWKEDYGVKGEVSGPREV